MPRIEFAPSLVSSLFQIVDPRAVKSSKEQLQWLKRNVPKLAFSHRPAMFNQAFIESAEQAEWLGPARPLGTVLSIRCSERVCLSGAIHSQLVAWLQTGSRWLSGCTRTKPRRSSSTLPSLTASANGRRGVAALRRRNWQYAGGGVAVMHTWRCWQALRRHSLLRL